MTDIKKVKRFFEQEIRSLELAPKINGCEMTEDWKEQIEICKMSISALEKQIPTKITHEATLYKCCTCPNCKNVVDEFIDFQGAKTRVTPSYCKYCGQALDWSDTE